MSGEIVKYHNDLNTVIMRKWTAEEMNFFFAIIAKLRDQGTKELLFDKSYLSELARYSEKHSKRFYETMDRLANNISQLRYIERTSSSVEYMPLFTYFKVEWESDLSDMKATVSVSDKFEYIINKLSAQFTRYELEEFTNIRSTYAKTAYRLLKQWRIVGSKEFKTAEFKTLLDMPTSYKSSEIDRAVIKPIIKELSQYFPGLKCEKIKSRRRGNPVIAYKFTWLSDKTDAYNPDKYTKQKKYQRKTANSIPDWSNPNYKNTTSKSEQEELEKRKKERLANLR